MDQPWLIDADATLTHDEYREGWRAYQWHRSGGWTVVLVLILGIIGGLTATVLGLMPDNQVAALGIERKADDWMGYVANGSGIAMLLAAVLITPLFRGQPVIKDSQPAAFRCNEFDVEIESNGTHRRWGWPEFFVFRETKNVYVLMRLRMFLIVPKRLVIGEEWAHWFRLMAEQSTQPRRDLRRDFEVIVNNPTANPADPEPPGISAGTSGDAIDSPGNSDANDGPGRATP